MLDDEISRFIEVAREFCIFIERAGGAPMPLRLFEARERLADLYAAACRLPSGEPAPDEGAMGQLPVEAPDFDGLGLYWEFYDPTEIEEPHEVSAHFGEELVEIYQDLQQGFAEVPRAGVLAAVWIWRFGFDSHWGDHAADALRAMHWACKRA